MSKKAFPGMHIRCDPFYIHLPFYQGLYFVRPVGEFFLTQALHARFYFPGVQTRGDFDGLGPDQSNPMPGNRWCIHVGIGDEMERLGIIRVAMVRLILGLDIDAAAGIKEPETTCDESLAER